MSDWMRGRRAAALDLVMSLLAVAGVTATVLLDLPVHRSTFAASDLKTLYASAWCLRHGLDAYSFASLQGVFRAQGMPAPGSWYGHAPVYPPWALAVLAPLTMLPIGPAVWVATVGSALLMALAVAALLRYAAASFRMPLGWRAVLAAVCAGGPLLAFALSVGNLSVAVSALCILAFARRRQGSMWVPGLLLALAVLLKPHLALWVVGAMLLLPEMRARGVAIRAAAIAVLGGCAASLAVAGGRFGTQTVAFLGMVRAETAVGGSMNAGSREILPVVSQITSLRSVLGFWTMSRIAGVVDVLLLLALGIVLVWKTLRVRGERESSLAVGTWCAFGLLSTYHRAHDGILLLVVAPWLIDRLRRHPRTWQAWLAVGLYGAFSFGPEVATIARVSQGGTANSPLALLLLRQASLAGLALCGLLLWMMWRGEARETIAAGGARKPARLETAQKSVSTSTPPEVTATTSQ